MIVSNTLHTAAHCSTLQHTATHCNTLQHTATHCNTLQHTATHCAAVWSVFETMLQCAAVWSVFEMINWQLWYTNLSINEAEFLQNTWNVMHVHQPCCQKLWCFSKQRLSRLWPGCPSFTTVVAHCSTLQYTATHCNTLPQCTAIQCTLILLHILFEHVEHPVKLLDYFLRSNKSNISQSWSSSMHHDLYEYNTLAWRCLVG